MSRNNKKNKKTDFQDKKKKKKDSGKPMKQEKMLDAIVAFFNSHPDDLFSVAQIAKALQIVKHPQRMQITGLVKTLIEDEYLLEVSKGLFKLRFKGSYVDGVFDKKSTGKNYVIPDDGGEPILIAERNSNHAMRDDRVKVRLFAKRKGVQAEGLKNEL